MLAPVLAGLAPGLDLLGLPACVLDKGLRYRYVNRAYAVSFGIAAEAIIGKTRGEVFPGDPGDDRRSVLDRALGGESLTFDRLTRVGPNRGRWVRAHYMPVRAGGEVLGAAVVLVNIQHLKDAEDTVRAREEELRFFAENIPEAIAYVDLERGCTFVNNLFLAARGLAREFILGKFPQEVLGQEEMRTLSPCLERVAGGETVVYERPLRIASTGQERWARVKLTPRKDETGRVQGYYVASNDIHDLITIQDSLQEKKRELREVIDSIPTPMVYVDAQYRYRYANDAFLDYVGKPAEEVIGQTVETVLGTERWLMTLPILQRVAAGESVTYERRIGYADGRSRWMSIRLTPRLGEGGRYLGYYAAASDIHEQKMVEEELRRAHKVLSQHFENTPLAVVEWDPELRAIRWSGNAQAIFGWTSDEVLGRSPKEWRLAVEEDVAGVSAVVRRLAEGPQTKATILNRSYRKDGSEIWVEWHHSALHDSEGRLVSILSLAHDVSPRIQSEERLQYMATHDGLTGLPNRLLLMERLNSAVSRAQRSGNRVAVMFLDLDHFKDVNDTLGHRIGDELLKSLAQRVRRTLRQSDLLARLSGDEFVVVLEDLEGDDGPDRVARKILDDVSEPFAIEGNELRASMSVGVAVFPEDGEDAEALLKNADSAMYHAKNLGRSSYRAFSRTLSQKRDTHLAMAAGLMRALRNGELDLHYQPVLDLPTGSVSYVEALLRWNDPVEGLLLPGRFMPVAENGGFMRDLGHWVFEAAVRQAAAWQAAGLASFTVAVNLSASQLRDPDIVSELEAVLARAGCAPGWLALEINETSVVRDIEAVNTNLRRLRGMGLRIAIDDFGTGSSSLSHLRHLPVDTLKIDRSFMTDIQGTAGSAAASGGATIVAAVTGLARGLGLEVVAQGVEHQSQLDFLRELGCRAFQGYLACPPLPAAELERWHASR